MNLGIIGRARSGKDTAGQWLVENRGYVRVSFADPIREAALKLDPIVTKYGAGPLLRLSDVLYQQRDGWEGAKGTFPEVRRILQNYGMTIRAIDPDFWLRTALSTVAVAVDAGHPVVITDVRFPNEAESLKRAGFELLYIDRPGVPHLDHESEGALTDADADSYILNNRTIYDLHHELSSVVDYARTTY